MVEKLTEKDIGRFVIFNDSHKKEKGRIKRFDNKAQVAWVVYNCNNDWDNYQSYTAAATHYKHLELA